MATFMQLSDKDTPIVAIWLRSPHSARNVSTKASTNTGDSCSSAHRISGSSMM